jgi:hypothetical protein
MTVSSQDHCDRNPNIGSDFASRSSLGVADLREDMCLHSRGRTGLEESDPESESFCGIDAGCSQSKKALFG